MKLILSAITHLEGKPACIPDPGNTSPAFLSCDSALVLRPVGEPYMSNGLEPGTKAELICDAEPRWVSVSLAVG